MKRKRTSCWRRASLAAALLAGQAAAAVAPQPASHAATAGLQEALLSVSLNGSPAGEPVALLIGPGDTFYASAAVLASWRLAAARPALKRDGVDYYLLNAISGLKLELVEATQTLSLTSPPESLGWTRLPYAKLDLGEELAGGTGAFVNYDLSGQIADGDTSLGGAVELGIFTRLGVGLANFFGRWSGSASELVRLDTSWTIDDPARMRSIRLGDGISRGGVGGGPLRFGGIQFARNFAVQPGFITIPLPALRGKAALPSVVDIYVNDALAGSRDVPPGPFEITEIPVVSGTGDVQLVVRDLLGREMLYSQSYYSAPRLLRQGLHDFSYEAGFLRDGFGLESNDYGAAMASATHRYGFSDGFTGEVHAEASRDIQLAGAAASLAVPGMGSLEASLGASRSDLGTGALAGLSFDRRTRGLSFGASAQLTSGNYMSLGLGAGRRPPASVIQAFVGLPTGFGSLGLSYLRRDGRGEPDAQFVSGSSSLRLGRLGSLYLAGRKSLVGGKEFGADLFLVKPLGRQTSTTTGAALDNGKLSYRTSIDRGLPVGTGLGYRFAASSGAVDRVDGKVALQTDFGTHDAQLTWTDGKTGVRMSTAGGVAVIGGHAFAARPLTQSFATVKVGDYPNVRVYADNQLVGRTGRNGTVVVPRLRPFDRNKLNIELADLPWDAEVATDERIVRPFDRHGVAVHFAARSARAAIVTILLANGSPLPAGSIVRVNQGTAEFVSAPGGDVYLTGLDADNRAVASWSGGTCHLRFRYPRTDDPQPRLGAVRCASALS